MSREPRLYNKYEDCCGCTACASICPRGAINFEYNKEGFLYPHIDLNTCIRCLLCEKVCSFQRDIIKNNEMVTERKIYAVKHKDQDVRKNSSSGGAFTALSNYYMSKGNAIASCIYSYEESKVKLCIYDDAFSRNLARGSKYIQAEIDDAFIKIYDWLSVNAKKELLIVGTGCQIAGLDAFLKIKKMRHRVVLVDLICHGSASSKLWKNFSSEIEKKNNGTIDFLTFKGKEKGWENPSVYAVINGKKVSINPFADWFYMGWSIRESCYQCPYTKVNRSSSDITIGDYWGVSTARPEFYDRLGVSLVIIQTQKGDEIFNSIRDSIYFEKISQDECIQPRLISPPIRPRDRDKFWQDMEVHGIEYCSKHYMEKPTIPFWIRIKNIVVRVLKLNYK